MKNSIILPSATTLTTYHKEQPMPDLNVLLRSLESKLARQKKAVEETQDQIDSVKSIIGKIAK